ncbi:MAG: nucleotidyltransferase family protein [Candidatus Limnocylindrales bacterium]
MTVAAAILSSTAEGALADTLGQPRVRRLADIAWSGGALPVIVLSPDPDGAVAKALAGAEATHGLPAPDDEGPAGQMSRAAQLALAEVSGTTAVLLWPARMTWVGPETITSLIEAHGTAGETMLRPAWQGEPGWPVLLPTTHLAALRAMAPDRMPPAIIDELARAVATQIVEVGDPGVTHDVDTPRDALPPYEGPPDPPAGHRHEWGEDVESEAGLDAPADERS